MLYLPAMYVYCLNLRFIADILFAKIKVKWKNVLQVIVVLLTYVIT